MIGISQNDQRIARQMADLARERGAGQSEAELKAEGFTEDEIRRCGPIAAQMLRRVA